MQGKLIGFAVVFMLVIAPAISYLYLKKGFDYRLESINQLQEKEISADLRNYINEHDPFKGNARLLHFPSEHISEELRVLDIIDERIVDRDRFDIISFGREPSINRKDKIIFRGASPYHAKDYQFMLLDTSNIVRGTYPYYDEVGKEIMRHLSVVIPIPRKREITLLRDTL